MKNYKHIFGIDVSKDLLDICEILQSQTIYDQIPNCSKNILDWISGLEPSQVLCVLEPTGAYSSRLLHYLSVQQIAICLVNPSQSNGFTQALGIISKDDRQAARTLALMGHSLELPLYQKPDSSMLRRKQLLMGLNALKKQKQMLENQLHALENQIVYAPKVVSALEQTLQTVEQQIEQLEEELNELSDEAHQTQLQLMQSVVGIGPKTAQLLLTATGGVQHFQRARQLAKFIGLVPASHQSGSSIRKTGRISKKGNAPLRASLYMAARSAKRYNLACKNLYERLRKTGKPHKQAMVAIMNKLIKQVFGVFNSGVSFDNQYYLKFIEN